MQNHIETFDHPPSVADLMSSFKEAEQGDPRSVFYKRVLVRPQVKLWPALAAVVAAVAVFLVAGMLTGSVLWAILITLALAVVLTLTFGKQTATYAIQMYQAYAPESVRNRCRYEPSCSQYTVLAMEKYGFIKGLIKGLRRWNGCKPPAGGYDMP